MASFDLCCGYESDKSKKLGTYTVKVEDYVSLHCPQNTVYCTDISHLRAFGRWLLETDFKAYRAVVELPDDCWIP